MILARLVGALLVLTLWLPTPALAARLLTSGFETNNLTATEWSSTSGTTPTIVTTAPHSGTYHLRSAPSAATSLVSRSHTNTTSGTFFIRFYGQFSTVAHSADIIIFNDASSGSAIGVQLTLLTTGKIRLTNVVTGTTVDTTATLSADTYYRFEVRHLLSDTAGEMEARTYLGDATSALDTLSITAEDTLNTNVFSFRFGVLTSTSTIVMYVDDVAINNATGTFQNSWPGPAKIALLVPNTEVTIGFTPNTGTDNSANVDDLPGAPDDDTTYNSTSTDNTVDRLGLTNLPAEVPSDADILLLDVYARIRGEGTTGTRQCRVELWDEAGVNTDGPVTNLIDNTAYAIPGTFDHLVYDPGARTKANIDSFDAGYSEIQSNDPMRVTGLWVNVEWIEAPPASPCPKTLATSGVGC